MKEITEDMGVQEIIQTVRDMAKEGTSNVINHNELGFVLYSGDAWMFNIPLRVGVQLVDQKKDLDVKIEPDEKSDGSKIGFTHIVLFRMTFELQKEPEQGDGIVPVMNVLFGKKDAKEADKHYRLPFQAAKRFLATAAIQKQFITVTW